jgi:hypothetical protein
VTGITLTGIACGGAAATVWCLQPEKETLKITPAARVRASLWLEDVISDKMFLLKTTQHYRVNSLVSSIFGRLDEVQRFRMLKKIAYANTLGVS